MFRSRWLLPIIVILFLFIAYMGVKLYSSSGDHVECPVKPFDEFAYLPDDTSLPIPKLLPNYPWQIEAVIPGHERELSLVFTVNIKLARTNNEEQEIWIFERPIESIDGTIYQEGSFLIYHPKSQTWEKVSAKIEGTNLIVNNLFETTDGTVWGTLFLSQGPPLPSKAPILSKFNESTSRFEAVNGVIDVSINEDVQEYGGLIDDIPAIVLDEEDNFWIFVQNDGIYRYETKTQSTSRQSDFPNPDIESVGPILAPDGSIYFRDHSDYGIPEFLFQFIPATGEIVTFDVPSRSWPQSGGMLADHRGRLWLGATGYMDTDGKWHRIHPHPRENIKHLGEPLWRPPTLIFQSSDGLLWYTEFSDMELLGEGTAWYNPETGQGCLFTNLASYIVEDAENQLWMIADGKLYRYPLK